MVLTYQGEVLFAQHREAEALEAYEQACADTIRKQELLAHHQQIAALTLSSSAQPASWLPEEKSTRRDLLFDAVT